MKLVELAPSMFRDIESFDEAVRFHSERALSDPEIRVVVYTNQQYQQRSHPERSQAVFE